MKKYKVSYFWQYGCIDGENRPDSTHVQCIVPTSKKLLSYSKAVKRAMKIKKKHGDKVANLQIVHVVSGEHVYGEVLIE